MCDTDFHLHAGLFSHFRLVWLINLFQAISAPFKTVTQKSVCVIMSQIVARVSFPESPRFSRKRLEKCPIEKHLDLINPHWLRWNG